MRLRLFNPHCPILNIERSAQNIKICAEASRALEGQAISKLLKCSEGLATEANALLEENTQCLALVLPHLVFLSSSHKLQLRASTLLFR